MAQAQVQIKHRSSCDGHKPMMPESEKLPEGLGGTLDGQKVAKNKVEEVLQVLEPIHQKYGHYLAKMRPWRDFVRISKPEGDLKKRLESNLSYFLVNYSIVMVFLTVASIVANPKCVTVIGVLALVWVGFMRKNEDPTWEVNVGGVALGKSQRSIILGVITAIVMISVVGQVLFSALFVCAIFVVIHGVLHPTVEGEQGVDAIGAVM
uniref:PRA1 family protein n=1 Tax=Noctiluca scintillans TaxID=2966 RepID=A0A7S1AIB9_NOCSC